VTIAKARQWLSARGGRHKRPVNRQHITNRDSSLQHGRRGGTPLRWARQARRWLEVIEPRNLLGYCIEDVAHIIDGLDRLKAKHNIARTCVAKAPHSSAHRTGEEETALRKTGEVLLREVIETVAKTLGRCSLAKWTAISTIRLRSRARPMIINQATRLFFLLEVLDRGKVGLVDR